jgi:serine/threonine protein kinase
MEYLDPSSWKPLSEYLSLPNSSAFAASIRFSIDKVLDILRDGGKVHGDLRPPNIMINVSSGGNVILVNDELGQSRANIKIMEFDWGGDAGKVFYPLLRNADIVGLIWPGKPGEPIKKTHDRRLVDSWWKESFSQDL